MLLAIDTCGPLGGVALGKFSRGEFSRAGGRALGDREPGDEGSFACDPAGLEVFAEREIAGKTYSELLLSTIAEMLVEANSTLSELTGIVIVRGPGSFTGIRIGVSAAKGLADALAIPVVAVSRLELLARRALDDGASEGAVAALDAGRGEFYVGFYRRGVCETELLMTGEMLAGAIGGSELPLLVCEERVFASLAAFHPKLVAAPVAVDALRLGAGRFQAELFDDLSTLDANYLRRSENEMLARIAEHAARRPATALSATK